jgi:hypothetical protein
MHKNEFDRVKFLKSISNRNKFSFWQCGIEDTHEWSYKIKNLIKELPTYSILFKWNVDIIEDPKCPKCKKEDWNHIWICEKMNLQ